MKKILVVEDSDMVMKVLHHIMQQFPQYQAIYATSMAQAQERLSENQNDIFAALVDLNLPDSPDGEIVDCILAQKIPTVVLTGTYDEKKRELLFNKGVVDYVTKEGRYAYNKAVNMIERLEKNQQIKVLVVDDSDMSRKHVVNLFKRHLFQVLEAKDGIDAIKILLETPGIKLLMTDYNMPRMDGFELVRNLRYKYDKTDLIMIGISGESNEALSAKFIKHGANDFLHKPFHPEEFYCRVTHNIEYLELIEKITAAAQRDHLTGLFHRHHFFNAARDTYLVAQEKQTPVAIAVINLDHFSDFNEKYGHEWGDVALKHVANSLSGMLERFLLCRADSDNFYVLMAGLDNEKAVAFISRIRQLVSVDECIIDGQPQRFYFSAGISNKNQDGIDRQIKRAMHLLQLGKEAGGNMVLGDDDEEETN
jgi:diguanylate cyclase (GGDEF)-like protein